LSFEALSRGAKQVISIEKDTQAFCFLEHNKHLLKTNKHHTIRTINKSNLKFVATVAQLIRTNTHLHDLFIDFNKNNGWVKKEF
jgi:16S rRNA G966 N2-methylase RsmD